MLTLSDLRGRPVILAFYPADWSPICADQVTRYNELLSDFHKHSAEILVISVDGARYHAAAFAVTGICIFPCSLTSSPRAQ
ncbi:redoxin domain-containing protein [Bradyrhizobium sp. UFLA01-814]|uniref:redoxin domain-containing protein n=1 Tax=Bradyrhizobium sp. UFLA01-814 TaxID=3023480 RepID=UPI00398B036D